MTYSFRRTSEVTVTTTVTKAAVTQRITDKVTVAEAGNKTVTVTIHDTVTVTGNVTQGAITVN